MRFRSIATLGGEQWVFAIGTRTSGSFKEGFAESWTIAKFGVAIARFVAKSNFINESKIFL